MSTIEPTKVCSDHDLVVNAGGPSDKAVAISFRDASGKRDAIGLTPNQACVMAAALLARANRVGGRWGTPAQLAALTRSVDEVVEAAGEGNSWPSDYIAASLISTLAGTVR